MNVCEAAEKRIEFAFKEFEQVFVSFSGGKDSGVVLNIALDVAKKLNMLDKLAVYHMDYEAQYQATTDFVTNTFEKLPEGVRKFWICLPVKVPCCVSMFQNFWQPWKADEKDIWCRDLPPGTINESNFNLGFDYNISDYEFNVEFGKAVAGDKLTVFLIGIRTQESLHRYRAVNKKQKKNEFKKKRYTTKITDNLVNLYPIFDWKTEDIWIYYSKFDREYNKLYDLYYQAGLSIHEMKVASPFISQNQNTLKLYKVIDPENWGKLISRVNGVNFTGLYGGTTAMGWRNIKKPKHFTWKQYMEFLLDTLPEDTRNIYLKKLEVSKASWRKGGARSQEIIDDLLAEKAPVILTGKISNRGAKNKQIIKFKDYLDDTNIKDFASVPSYKRMCICIMKNDITCKYMGFAQTKWELEKRKKAIKKYANL